MNKKAKRRAFVIFLAMFVIYGMVAAKVQDRFNMRKISAGNVGTPQTASLAVSKSLIHTGKGDKTPGSKEKGDAPSVFVVPLDPIETIYQAGKGGNAEKGETGSKTGKEDKAVIPPAKADGKAVTIRTMEVKADIGSVEIKNAATPKAPDSIKVEPSKKETPVAKPPKQETEVSLLVAAPIVGMAIKEGLIDKDGLLLVSKCGSAKPVWKKPVDILADKDTEGLEVIARIIGKRKLVDFLHREGLTKEKDLSAEDVILGKGYAVDKTKLVTAYNKYVPGDYEKIFPYAGVAKMKNSYGFVSEIESPSTVQGKSSGEWQVPNLTNLPVCKAIELLSVHTSKVKVFGSGTVVEQKPRAFERVQAETEVVLYGRTYKR